jgi:hypothetical protein
LDLGAKIEVGLREDTWRIGMVREGLGRGMAEKRTWELRIEGGRGRR